MTPNSRLDDFQKKIGVHFKNSQILKQALTHRSYLNENKELTLPSNERYEFLGDAVLELWASETLFTLFPSYNEGYLTNLRSLVVCTQNLAQVATNLRLGDYIFLSRGEIKNQGQSNPSILADCFEALIGAIYLDQDQPICHQFLNNNLLATIKLHASQKNYKDPKSYFQELAQNKTGTTPRYQVVSETGPDHNKTFEVGLYLGSKIITTGSGLSKQKAEEEAATKAISQFDNKI